MSNTVKIIQVGLGGWGQDWAKSVVAKNSDVETTAWVEISPTALEAAQKRLSLPEDLCFTSLDKALETVESDAVLVTASLPGHVPSVETALLAGKHVLVEKPFTPTVADAQRLVKLADEQNKTLMVSQNYRFASAPRVVTELIKQQVIGNVGTVNIDFRQYDNVAPFEERIHYHIAEPLLLDMSIHHFDLMRMVIGQEPKEISCRTWNSPWSKYKEPAEGVLTVFFDGGAVVNYRGSWVSPGPKTNWSGDWSMEGDKGQITWTSRGEIPESVQLRLLGEKPEQISLPVVKDLDRSGSLAAFVESLRTGVEPETSGRRNIPTLALMFAAIESAQKGGQPVTIG